MPEHSEYEIDFLASVEAWNLILHIQIVRVNSRDSCAIYPCQLAINSPMIEI